MRNTSLTTKKIAMAIGMDELAAGSRLIIFCLNHENVDNDLWSICSALVILCRVLSDTVN